MSSNRWRMAVVVPLMLFLGMVSLYGQGGPNPVPQIAQPLVPMTAAPGGGNFTLTVNGTGFVSTSQVNWNGSGRTTTFVSSTQLTAAIDVVDVAAAGTAFVTVVNPSPGGGTSNVAFFHIIDPFSPVAFGRRTYALTNSPRSVITADFNADDKLDLVVSPGAISGLASYVVTILLGNGDGTFQAGVDYGTSSGQDNYPDSVFAADFNADGKLDLAVTDVYYSKVSILLGNGDGTFQDNVDYATGFRPHSVAAGDFNADGKLDLVVPGSNDDTVSILLGNGDGTFQAKVDYATGFSPQFVTAGDFNGDAKLDLAVANLTSYTVSILLGNGDGTFQAKVDYATGPYPDSVTTADFNGDGKLDLGVANQTSYTVSILLGNGDGTFQAKVDYATGFSPYFVTAGDFNGDAKLDLAVANSGSNTVSILLGNGDGTFQAKADFSTGTTPYSVAAGDFNGDGMLDLATADGGDNTVSILLLVAPVVQLSATSLDFGELVFGISSAIQQVTLTNTGSATLTFTSFNVQLSTTDTTASPDFAQNNDCGASLTAGAFCTLNVSSTPSAFGPLSAVIKIVSDAPESPHFIALSATGISAAIVSGLPGSLDFGSVLVGSTSVPQSAILTNTGTGNLGITSIVASGDFAQTNTCGTSLAAGANCSIDVTFTPTVTGAATGAVTITDDASGSPHIIVLTGTGVQPAVSLSAASLTLPGTPLDMVCPSRTVTVSNTGGTPVAITSIAINTDEFVETNDCPASLAPGVTCTITVTFYPATLGLRQGTLTVASDDPNSPHSVALEGEGLPPCNLMASRRSATVLRGTQATDFEVSDSNPSCTPDPIELSCANNDPATCTFSPAIIPPSGRSNLRLGNLTALRSDSLNFVVNSRSDFRTASIGLSVLVKDFAFTSAPDVATVTAGETASYALAIRPVNGFAGSLSLSCSGAPRGATCTVTPTQVTLDGASLAQVKVNVRTTARAMGAPSVGPQMTPPGASPLAPWTAMLAALMLASVVAMGRRRALLALAMALVMVLMWAACGGGGFVSTGGTNGTPAGTSALTITGTYTTTPEEAAAGAPSQVTGNTTLTLTVR